MSKTLRRAPSRVAVIAVMTLLAALLAPMLPATAAPTPTAAAEPGRTFTGSVNERAVKLRAHAFNVASPGRVTATLSWSAGTKANLDLGLRSPAGAWVAWGSTAANPETVTFDVKAAGKWTLGVSARSGAASYTLRVELAGDAEAVTEPGPGTFTKAVNAQGVKWRTHRVRVLSPGTLTATLTWQGKADLDLGLRGPGGKWVAWKRTRTAADASAKSEQITYPATATGKWTLGVSAHRGAARYTLSVALADQHQAPPSTASALVTIEGYKGIATSSSYNTGFFKITNTSPDGQKVERVTIDLAGTLLPDMVFDPSGEAGDVKGKCATPDSGADATGYVVPVDACVDPFSKPRAGGYETMELAFADFGPGETFTFSVDVDPLSIKGRPTDGGPGAVSGLELVGASTTVAFDDDSTYAARTYRKPNSDVGSQNTVKAGAIERPALQVLGLPATPATVTSAQQVVRITGPASTGVALLIVEGALDLEGAANGGFEVAPYDANSAVKVTELTTEIGSDGIVDLPVTLTRSADNAGLNHLVAAVKTDGRTGPLSNLAVLQLADPSAATLAANPASLEFGSVEIGQSSAQTVTLTHAGAPGTPALTIDAATVTGASGFTSDLQTPVTLAAGESKAVAVTFAPLTGGAATAQLTVAHSGVASPVTVALTGTGVQPGEEPAPSGALFRVNAGGPALPAGDGGPGWGKDGKGADASPYVNAVATGNLVAAVSPQQLKPAHASVPTTVPLDLFASERYDKPAEPGLQWDFPVGAPGRYDVRLYFAETYMTAPGQRTFDVSVEGKLVLDDYDVFADVGSWTPVMKSFSVTSDANLDVDFAHGVQNPAVKGIEIVPVSGGRFLSATPASVDFGAVLAGQAASKAVTLAHTGQAGDPAITVAAVSAGGDFAAGLDTPVVVTPGKPATVAVTFAPTTAGTKSAALSVSHDGDNAPLTVPLQGTGATGGAAPVSFKGSQLAGASSFLPTSLQFGPDGRLYVAQQDGTIKAYTVERDGPSDYDVTGTETITLVKSIPNHDDDGSPANLGKRQVTGIVVTGTPSKPVLYVTSSDPRIGGGGGGSDTNLDTNSGIVSRLTKTGSGWSKLDLVRGLPRSEENHSQNGLQLDEATNTLYVTSGGHTNMGAPSHNFAKLPEYALSAALLSVDLDAIGETTYDLPTLKNTAEPFGGQSGANQAKLVTGGPVQVHSPGYRNPYDVVITQAGRLYTWDNGSNAGWGAPPKSCTNDVQEPGATQPDSLHFVDGKGYYGGHANPTRASTANTFGGKSPVPSGNAVECTYLAPGSQNGSLTTNNASTNGLDEYTASNFGGAMKGDLLAAAWDGPIWRVQLSAAGDAVTAKEKLFPNLGSKPLDVTAQGDSDVFAGTVWAAVYGEKDAGAIQVFEPSDYDGAAAPICSGADDAGMDEDADGYDNADELDTGTDPCSAGSVPADRDGDGTSNLNDPDDDNDGLKDTSDAFAVDPDNGMTTDLPVSYTWDNDVAKPEGLLDLGFTGLMTNGTTDYEQLFDGDDMTAGGAAGVTTVDKVPAGDAHKTANSQQYGFQFGVDAGAASGPFTAHTRILAPFAGLVPQDYQSMGLFVGTGDQDNYAKLVVTANGGKGGIEFLKEVAAASTPRPKSLVPMPGPEAVDLYLTVDPDAGTVQPSYAVDGGARVNLGGPEPIPASWVAGTKALAVGILSTSSGPGPEFPATWDLIEVTPEPGEPVDPAPASGTEAATLEVNASGGLNASTFSSGAFTLRNDSPDGQKIAGLRLDLRPALLPDVVFDPDGVAGDSDSKGFEINTNPGVGTVTHAFSGGHDDGYDVLDVAFTNFAPGKQLAFSVDVDPTSIRGSAPPGPNSSGSISGLEMTGAEVTVTYAGGATQKTRLFPIPGSAGGSRAVLKAAPPAAPTIALLGSAAPATVSSAGQAVRVSGPAGAKVRLLAAEAGLFLAGAGYDVQPYEANSVVTVAEKAATIGAGGTVDVPVTLTRSAGDAGLNHLVAVVEDGGGRAGPTSQVLVVELAAG